MVMRSFNATTQSRTGTLTEIVEQIDYVSQGTSTVSLTAIPYCREKTIAFTAYGLKPYTKVYIFFDKQAVGAHVTPNAGFSSADTPVAGSQLVTDAIGRLNGTFVIPDPKIQGNPRFQTGDIEFIITSDSKNLQVGDGTNELIPRTTYASTVWSAVGTLDTQQETIHAVRNAVMRTSNVSESSTSIGAMVQQNDGGNAGDDTNPGDPLAQTFIVADESKLNSGDQTGHFVTSCDIFFSHKDDNYPVILELRSVDNGYPGPMILPFGRKVLLPEEVNTSTDAKTATTFTFPSLVYLQHGFEYCLCLLSDSIEYKVWISDLGTQDTDGNEVSEQPHVGVLFKGSNNRTWNASHTQDLKFSLKCAEFDITAAGSVTLQNKALPVIKTLKAHPLEMTDASTTLLVNQPNHQLYDSDNNVTIASVVSGAETTLNGAITAAATSITLTSGTNFDDTSGKYSRLAASLKWLIMIDDEIIEYTSISDEAITGATRGTNSTTAAAHANGATVKLYQLHKVPLTEINKTHTTITNINIDTYTITLSTTPVVDGSGGSAMFGGRDVTFTENYQYDVSTTNIGTMVPNRTTLTSTVRNTTGTSPSGSEESFVQTSAANAISVPLNDNHYWDTTNIIASGINETNEMSGSKSLVVPMTLSSKIDSLSPVIDTERMSFVTVHNRINKIDAQGDIYPTTKYNSLTEPDGDNNAAIYLTKKITLETPATSIRVLLDANRDNAADIKLLYKTLGVDDASDFDELPYEFFNPDSTVSIDGSGGPDVSVNPSLTLDQFNEYEYTAGVTDDGIGTALSEFISFQIKIVMMSTNSARPPRIKSLRALALAT